MTPPSTPTAPPRDQLRLLEVQALDTRLAQIAHRRATLPENAALAEREKRAAELRDEVVLARTALTDVGREMTRAEADVDLVRQRAARDRARLDAGTGSAKDLQALSAELESLARRQAQLEDVELEVMERQEAAQAALVGIEQLLAEVEAGVREAAEQRDAALARLDEDAEHVRAQRAQLVAQVDPGLVELYEQVRADSGGLGAAPLRGRRCEGCRLEQTPVEMGRIRSAPEDAVLRCDECGRILVRTEESAL